LKITSIEFENFGLEELNQKTFLISERVKADPF